MKIARDKWKHFYVGIVMGVVLQLLAFALFSETVIAIAVAALAVIAISYGFEVFSKVTGKGHYEVMDAIAAIIGGAFGMVAVILFWL